MEEPKVGSKWQHFKGGKYVVIANALNESDRSHAVVYQSLENRQIWVRSLNSFTEKVTKGDNTFPRFTEIKEFD